MKSILSMISAAFYVYLFALVLFSSSIGIVEASAARDHETILTRETIANQALNHYLALQQSQLQLRSQIAQLGYLQTQRDLEATSFIPMKPGYFPTSMDELIRLIPDYEQLSDEQKKQMESVLAIQSMIHTSLNQYIDAQTQQQNATLFFQQQQNLKSLDEQLRSASFGVQSSVLEMEKTKLLVQFYAFQSVYQIVMLEKDLNVAELEQSYLEQNHQDAQKLLEAGQLTSQDAEDARLKMQGQQQAVAALSQQLTIRKKLLNRDLGYKESQQIMIPNKLSEIALEEKEIAPDVRLDEQIEMKMANAAIQQAEASYNTTKSDNSALAIYYKSIISIETDKKGLVARQLEKKKEELTAEQLSLLDELDRLQEERVLLMRTKNDQKKLFQHGLISGREVEAVEYEITKLDIAIEKTQISYEIWKEKKWAALHGLLI
ncbi:hypothetical protein RB620_22960 [Paenibacillus sp. LHD-117]|uniref:hypothetical protein n=1 Tax=Paenibacillus sp. LHD-117 TaxID=3071412 RepID=UPI0027E18B6A|nr:hypothetical protein [Paenibacillus sp. LHD-117]MDQ6422293.1 hypothetical protein [Paenibacillus sp. LHD-117]